MRVDIKNLINEEVKMGKTFVVIKANEQADENAFQIISHTKPPFIPPITASEVNGVRVFNYDVSADGLKNISNLPSALSSAEFLLLMKNLTGVIVQSRDYLLDPFNFLMLEEFIFIHQEKNMVRVVYLPLYDTVYSEIETSRQIYNLARNLSRRFSANDSSNDWQSVNSHLWNMSENTTVFEAHELYTDLYAKSKSIDKKPPLVRHVPEPPKSVAEPEQIKKEPEPKKGLFGKSLDAPQKKSLFGKKEDSNEPKPKKSLFGSSEKKPKPPKAEKKSLFGKPKSLPVINDLTEPDLTEPLTEEMGGRAVLYILEQGAKTVMIPINKDVFTIGRNRDEVDYCFDGPNDKPISRVHVAVSFSNGSFMVTDKNSSGGTLLDGKKITPGTSESLKHGSIIKIGRRELLFELA
jgi:hypothetical protein